MRVTQKKGDLAVVRAIFIFTEMGYDVSIPVTESAEYDLIVDCDGNLYKVQVKSCKTKQVDLRKIHSNSKGYVIKKYSHNAYDWLYVYDPVNRVDYLSREFILTNTKSLSTLEKLEAPIGVVHNLENC